MTRRTVRLRYEPPVWASGHIAWADARFLNRLVADVSPRAMLEIGVASGCSSAVLLGAMSAIHDDRPEDEPWLFSFDIAERCYFDPSRRVGEAVDELVPELRRRWRLTMGDALSARQMLTGRQLALAFIDGSHRHPWPTLDLLAILSALRPGAWVALHDIQLARVDEGRSYQFYGAQFLFDAWSSTKRSEDNIGAIRIDSLEEARACCLRLLDRWWETSVPDDTLNALGLRGIRAIEEGRSPADFAINRIRETVAPTRPVIVWSAGQAGREFLARAQIRRFAVAGVVDRDGQKQGQVLHGVVIHDPLVLDELQHERPFVAVCGIFADEISDYLNTRGFVVGRDYIVV